MMLNVLRYSLRLRFSAFRVSKRFNIVVNFIIFKFLWRLFLGLYKNVYFFWLFLSIVSFFGFCNEGSIDTASFNSKSVVVSGGNGLWFVGFVLVGGSVVVSDFCMGIIIWVGMRVVRLGKVFIKLKVLGGWLFFVCVFGA